MPRKQLRFGRGFYILSGKGSAVVGRWLKTLNLYVPPAYTSMGDPLPAGRK